MFWPCCFSDIKIVENPLFVPDRCNNNDDSIAPNLILVEFTYSY